MQKNAIKRVGVSIQGTGMAWCICYKENGEYFIDELEKSSTSFSKLNEILSKRLPVYTNQVKLIRANLRVNISFIEVKTEREDVEALIASNINEGNVRIDDNRRVPLEQIIKEDYLIQERETPSAEALHFGLGELIYQSTRPYKIAVGQLTHQFIEANPQYRLKTINFDGRNADRQSSGMQKTNQIRCLYYEGLISYEEMNRRLNGY